MDVQDSGLVGRIRQRDVAAFEALYDEHHRLVYGVALRMLGDAMSAEDCTQGVFLKLWSDPDAFRGGNFVGWIARVTRNRCLDVLRSRAMRPEGEMPVDVALDFDLDRTVLSRIDADRVRTCLGELPDDQRVPIELGFFGGMTHEEIARRTATALGTTKTRIRTGLRRLRAALEHTGVR